MKQFIKMVNDINYLATFEENHVSFFRRKKSEQNVRELFLFLLFTVPSQYSIKCHHNIGQPNEYKKNQIGFQPPSEP